MVGQPHEKLIRAWRERKRDLDFWGGAVVGVLLIPAGGWGVWYELFRLGEICFHLYWGVAAWIIAAVMLYGRVSRMRRFRSLMRDESAAHFLRVRPDLEQLVRELPTSCRRAYDARLEATAPSRRLG